MMTQKRKLDDVSHVSISNPKETISRSKTSVVTDEDFDIALDLLRRPPTPDDTKFFNDRPQVDISPAPVNRFSVTSPIQIIQTKNENNNQIRSTIQEEQQVHFSLSRANSLVGGPIENEPVTPERVSSNTGFHCFFVPYSLKMSASLCAVSVPALRCSNFYDDGQSFLC